MRALFTLKLVFFVLVTATTANAIDATRDARIEMIDRSETALQRSQPGARFLILDGRIERIYGAPLARGRTAAEAAGAFVERHAKELYGVAPDELVLHSSQDVMFGKFTATYYVQRHTKLPVHGAGLMVLVRHDADDAVVLVSGRVFPLADVALPAVALTADAAVAAVARQHAEYTFRPATLVVLVRDLDGDGVEEVLPAYRFTGGNDDLVAPQKFEFLVDACDPAGAIVGQESQIDFEDIAGTVQGNGSSGWRPDRADNPPVPLPIEEVRVRVAGGATVDTDATGAFLAPHPGTAPVMVETSLSGIGVTQSGRWARIVNGATGGTLSASQLVTPPGPVALMLNTTPSELLTSQVNAFIHVTRVHDFAIGINPAYPGLDIQMAVNVNLNSSCNAFYDRDNLTVNFYRSGGGCPNMAYSSVVYHEYGHHIINRAYNAAGLNQPGSQYHEGYADTTSYMLMDDPCLGYGFFGGNACLRTGANNLQHPCSGGGHDCAGVISGSFWDTREELQLTEPGNALPIIRDLYLNSILLVPTAVNPGITIDVLTLDDDDDSLTNGTPHYEEIALGFGAHSLDAPPLTDLIFSLADTAPTLVSPGGGTRFRVIATPVASQANPALAFLHVSTGGPFTAIPMEQISVSEFDAVFPTSTCTATLQYYVSVTSDRGNVFRLPTNAPAVTYAATSAYAMTQLLNDNFQNDLGWTVVNDEDLVFGGWERGVPAGNPVSGVPPADYDGSGMAYVTGPLPGQNVDGAGTSLISPAFDFAGDTPLINFAVWFNNSTGTNPGQDTLVVSLSNDDGETWTPLETFGPTGPGSTGGWNARAIDVSDILPTSGPVRMRFYVSDIGGASVVEASVDAFRASDFTCVANNLPGDMNCDGLISFFDIDPFVTALFDPAGYQVSYPTCRLLNADLSGDGLVNFFDIDGFVALLFP